MPYWYGFLGQQEVYFAEAQLQLHVPRISSVNPQPLIATGVQLQYSVHVY